jgi:hypothetical protein
MTATSTLQRSGRPVRRVEATHLFAVGQSVRLRSGFGRPGQAAEIYHVRARLPPSGNALQYRIRNIEEHCERVATQDELEAIDVAESGASLAERTFDRG